MNCDNNNDYLLNYNNLAYARKRQQVLALSLNNILANYPIIGHCHTSSD